MNRSLTRMLILATAALAGCESSLDVDVVVQGYAPDTEVVLNLEGVALVPTGSGAAVEIVRNTDLALRVLDDADPVATTLISNATPTGGEYRGLRLLFDDDEGTLTDRRQLPVVSRDIDRAEDADPADDQIAEVAFLFEEDDDNSQSLIVVLDLPLSLSRPEPAGEYFLAPVVRAMESGDQARVTGTVLSTLLTGTDCTDGGVAIYAYPGEDITPVERTENGAVQPVATTLVELDGAPGPLPYSLSFMPPGIYTLALTCDAEDDNGVEPAEDEMQFVAAANVELDPGESRRLDFVVP